MHTPGFHVSPRNQGQIVGRMTAAEKRIRKALNDFALKKVIQANGDRGNCAFCNCPILRFQKYRRFGTTEAHDDCITAVRKEYK